MLFFYNLIDTGSDRGGGDRSEGQLPPPLLPPSFSRRKQFDNDKVHSNHAHAKV